MSACGSGRNDSCVAMVGAGTIAVQYLEGLRATPGFEVSRICSNGGTSAIAVADQYALLACSLEEILSDPAINYVINLTPADVHERITLACLSAAKSVYSEKPLARTVEVADALIALADQQGLLLACAPATFLWPPLATARRLLDEGRLGHPVGAMTTLVYPGPEIFHPTPMHLYGPNAGPLRDMGVYQVTALMSLLGPVDQVAAMSSRAKPHRKVRVGPHAGRSFEVTVPTHIHAQLRHTSGAISNVVVSFDAVSASRPTLEIFGDGGGLVIRDWHTPTAELTLSRAMGKYEDVPLDHGAWSTRDWAIGPISAWRAYKAGAKIETSAQRARDVLQVLCAIEDASTSERTVTLEPSSSWERPSRLVLHPDT